MHHSEIFLPTRDAHPLAFTRVCAETSFQSGLDTLSIQINSLLYLPDDNFCNTDSMSA